MSENGGDPLAQLLEALVLGEEDQAVSDSQHGNGRPGAKVEILSELLGDR
jgi:hypothetical protein